MGSFKVPIDISNIEGGDSVRVLALVDTGATHSRAPGSILYGLRIPDHGEKDVVIGDGTVVQMKVCTVRIACQGKMDHCPMFMGTEDSDVLLGATSLEILGFTVDPINQCLESAPLRM